MTYQFPIPRLTIQPDPHRHLRNTFELVRQLGWKLGLDLDGVLTIEPPPSVSVEAITDLLSKAERVLVEEVKADAQRQRAQYVGGPMNGQQHGFYGHGKPLPVRIKRGQWAAYYLHKWDDRRAFFVGMATSEAKARQLAKRKGREVTAGKAD